MLLEERRNLLSNFLFTLQYALTSSSIPSKIFSNIVIRYESGRISLAERVASRKVEKYDYRLERIPISGLRLTCQTFSPLQRSFATIGRRFAHRRSDWFRVTCPSVRRPIGRNVQTALYRDVFNPALPTFQLAFREEGSARCASEDV